MMRVRAEHWQLILSVCERNPELLTNRFNGPEGKAKGNALWQNVSTMLNGLGFGEKSVEGWRKALTDWKCKAKSKAAALKREQQQTGGGPPQLPPLSSLEERLLVIMGTTALHGDKLVPELGFGKVEIPKTVKSVAQNNENRDETIQVIEVMKKSSKSSTSHDHDYELDQKPLSDNVGTNLKRKLECQDTPKKNTRIRRSRPNNVVHLSNELLNLNTETVQLLKQLNTNTENISNSLAAMSRNTESIANSLSEIANSFRNLSQ